MVQINFDEIPDADDYSPIPQGDYLCTLVGIEDGYTKNNDEMWKLQWEVVSGEYAGRKIFDNMVFSEKALKRVKLICSRLGLNTVGGIDLVPDMIQGKQALVSVTVEEYVNDKGEKKQRNSVPFAGYERAGESKGQPGIVEYDDEVPF